MSDVVISFRDLGKRYSIDHERNARATSLREAIYSVFRRNGRSLEKEEFWALRGISADIRRGEIVGLIGRNGAGKSTLLKLLSRITPPSKGSMSFKGRLSSLLEVGTGFHPELTGRENIYLNGAILGMKQDEIRQKFDAIVDFSEIEKFLDTPVKRYSSGMYMRLAFAVAAHLEPDILVVDEVLAVGDAAFQKKCLGKMSDVSREGRTVLFVSHNMAAVRTLCNRVIVLKSGQTICDTHDVGEAMSKYSGEVSASASWNRLSNDVGGKQAVFTSLSCEVKGSQPQLTLVLDVTLRSLAHHSPAFLAFDIMDRMLTPVMQALPESVPNIKAEPGTDREYRVVIDLPPLIPGEYLVTAWMGTHYTNTLDQVPVCTAFTVATSPTVGRSYPHTADHGFIVPPSRVTSHSVFREMKHA